MKFTTHANAKINIHRTALQGTLQATKAQLVKVFGEPMAGAHEYTTCDWHIQFENNVVATIYDWRNAPETDQEVCRWHIGGFTRLAVDQVHDAFRKTLGLGQERVLAR